MESDAFVETIPYDQTRRYVMRVSALAAVYQSLYSVHGPLYPLTAKLPTTLGEFDAPHAATEATTTSTPQEKL